MNRLFKHRGFTLLEVLVSVAIFSIVIEAIYSTVIISRRSLNVYAQTAGPKEGLRAALGAMVKELREAGDPLILQKEHNVTMSFQSPLYGNIKYSWTDTGTDAGKLMRITGKDTSVMAYNITHLSLTLPYSNNQVLIDIVDGGSLNGTPLELKEKVALRMQTGLF
jgi:prepilin-type N-terminal cleavage/methylation domain-containing protein